ncbi:uncharacterized protein LOC127735567 isoform X2 [Mytilus californianus]|uniref:uncharacterized protein LOC127735567 isoform X2 n=1 Tax=Mytilus californianus TaxID=6549 RepID=UPI002248266F|nr:uncharacterized protein LOC127735567 isoform X2 [Mytilus californianus]
MADGDENGARKKMQEATAKFLERRNREHETVDTEHGRIVMPSLSNKWQTIIDDTLIPQIQQNTDFAVRKRSRSIAPEDDEGRRPRPLSMPNVASSLPFEIHDAGSNQEEPPLEVEISLQAGEHDDQSGRSQRSRLPAKLDPIDNPRAPPSYNEALKMNGGRELPQSLPVYGRLWQMGRQWSREAGNHDPQFEPKVSTSEDAIEPYSASESYASGRSLPPIAKGDSIDGLSKEARFTDIDAIPERQQSYRAATTRTEFDVEEGRREEERKRFECDNCFGNRFPRVVRYLNSLTLQKFLILVTIATVIIGLILFVGIFPASFVYVEYHEMALLKNKVTGTVDRDTVYFTGCYVLGPDKEFIRYPKYGNTISMTTDVFTIDKLEITMSFHLQYYIRSSELGDLHRQYEQDYNGVLRNVARSEIKNHVGQFSLDYFRLNRTNLEKYILTLLQARFEGDCCQSCCPSSCTNNTVCATCLPVEKCHPGYHVDIKYFQLTQISIPSEVSNLFVQQLVLQVEAEKEFLLQSHSLVQKETEKLTKKLKNEANEILEEAQANSSKALTLAEADREASLTSAYVHGLKYLYLTLGVNSEEHQLSLMMIRALEDSNVKGNLYRGYGYNTSTIVSSP